MARYRSPRASFRRQVLADARMIAASVRMIVDIFTIDSRVMTEERRHKDDDSICPITTGHTCPRIEVGTYTPNLHVWSRTRRPEEYPENNRRKLLEAAGRASIAAEELRRLSDYLVAQANQMGD